MKTITRTGFVCLVILVVAAGAGCTTTNSISPEKTGSSVHEDVAARKTRHVFSGVVLPAPGRPELRATVDKVITRRMVHTDHYSLRERRSPDLLTKILISPIYVFAEIASGGKSGLYEGDVWQTDTRDEVAGIRAETQREPARKVRVQLACEFGNEEVTLTRSTRGDGVVIFDLADTIRAAFENIQTTNLNMLLKTEGVSPAAARDFQPLREKDLESIYRTMQ